MQSLSTIQIDPAIRLPKYAQITRGGGISFNLLIERHLIDSFGIQLFFKLYFILAIIFIYFLKFIFNIKILIHFPSTTNTNKSKPLRYIKIS